MKKIIIALLVLISHSAIAQLSTSLSQNKPKTIVQDGNCRIQFIDSTGTQVHEMLCINLKYWYEKSYPNFGGKKITIFDGFNKIYIENDGSLTNPTFANLDDSLNVWKQCEVGGTGTDPIDYSGKLDTIITLLTDSLDKNIFIENDSIRVWFNNPLDTSNAGILNAIYNQLVDSLDKQLYVLNPYIDSAIVRRMDTIIDRLTTTEKLDTLKGLVYTASAKVRTNRDTLFNCKSISFGRKSTASGTLVLTFENGESESFDVANDDLPAWVNGEFISYLDYNATGAVGLIVNTLGCSQTDAQICAKIKPIFDCELVVPITCNGWQSGSGIWSTLSGCWNTGQ